MSTYTSIRRRADHLIIRNLLALSLVLTVAGCATLETGADHVRDFAIAHPVVTAVGTAVVIGAVAALDHHRHEERTIGPERPVCGREAC